jgi:AraC-like DNA-binding protein
MFSGTGDELKNESYGRSFNKVIQFLTENTHRTLTLSEMAAHAHFSPSHFSIRFKEIAGYSPVEYFNHLKLQKVCWLLRFTQLRISEIADQIGIEDPYYFSR